MSSKLLEITISCHDFYMLPKLKVKRLYILGRTKDLKRTMKV